MWKTLSPTGSISVWFTSFYVWAVMFAMSAKPPGIYVLQISFFYTTIPFGYVKGPFLFFMRCICENLRCPVILIQSHFDTKSFRYK